MGPSGDVRRRLPLPGVVVSWLVTGFWPKRTALDTCIWRGRILTDAWGQPLPGYGAWPGHCVARCRRVRISFQTGWSAGRPAA